ncbi:MAG: hypothetical protein AB7F40_00015 [Victivallaceae bacterium]
MFFINLMFCLLAGGALSAATCRTRMETALLPHFCLLVLSAFVFGWMDKMSAFIYFEYGLCAIFYIVAILWTTRYHRWHEFIKNFFTPGLLFFIVGAIILYYISRPMTFITYDEFSHWAVVTKNMYLHNGFIYKYANLTRHGNYPPGLALIQYVILTIYGSFSEGIALYAINLFLLSALCIVMFQRPWKTPLTNLLLGTAALLLPLTCRIIGEETNYAYDCSYAEFPMALVWGYLLIIESSAYRRPARLIPIILTVVPTLCLIKKNCIFIVALTFILYLTFALVSIISAYKQRSPRRHKNLIANVAMLASFASGCLIVKIWNVIIATHNITGRFDQLRPLCTIKEWFYNAPKYAFGNKVTDNFLAAVFTRDSFNLGFIKITLWGLIVALSVWIAIIGFRQKQKIFKILALFVFLAFILYLIQLWIGYMLLPDFGDGSNQLTSWPRYLIVPITAFSFTAFAVAWQTQKRNLFQIFSLGFVFLLIPAYYSYVKYLVYGVESQNTTYRWPIAIVPQVLATNNNDNPIDINLVVNGFKITRDKHPRPFAYVLNYLEPNYDIKLHSHVLSSEEIKKILKTDYVYIEDVSSKSAQSLKPYLSSSQSMRAYRRELPNKFCLIPLQKIKLNFEECNPLIDARLLDARQSRSLDIAHSGHSSMQIDFLPGGKIGYFSWNQIPVIRQAPIANIEFYLLTQHNAVLIVLRDGKNVLENITIHPDNAWQLVRLDGHNAKTTNPILIISSDQKSTVYIDDITINFSDNENPPISSQLPLTPAEQNLSIQHPACYSGTFFFDGKSKISYSATVVNTGDEQIAATVNYLPVSKNHIRIYAHMISQPETSWQLLPCKTEITNEFMVTPNSDFSNLVGKSKGIICMPLGEKEPLPLENMVGNKIIDISTSGKVTLEKPIQIYDGGTIFVHTLNTNGLNGDILKLAPGERGTLNGTISGTSAEWSPAHWPLGTQYVELRVMLLNPNKFSKATVNDFSLTLSP